MFEPTATTFGYAAGNSTPSSVVSALPALLPLAPTMTTPAFQALSIESCSDDVPDVAPRLRLITFAPCETAQSMPCDTANVLPLPVLSSTFTGMILHSQQTPAPPTMLFVFAAMMPDTNVPWLLSSVVIVLFATKLKPAFAPVVILPLRSGWPASTPVSTTATMTLALPVVVSHAAGSPICGRLHWYVV